MPDALLIEPMWDWNSSFKFEAPPSYKLLIEPMWDWNSINTPFWHCGSSTFNRTNVGLKLNFQNIAQLPRQLLIEPMWDWNTPKRPIPPKISTLLIEPMWDWNRTVICVLDFNIVSFNRTNVGLKYITKVALQCGDRFFYSTPCGLDSWYFFST